MMTLSKEILEPLLVAMLAVVKNMELYPPDHPSVRTPLARSHELFDELLRSNGSITLGIVEEVLVFGGIPFYPNQLAVNELQKRLETRNASTLEFVDGLTAEEFSSFAQILKEDPESARKFSHFSEALRARGIEHIVAKDSKEIYSRAIDAVGETLQEARLGRIPKASKARAAVADMKRMILTDQHALLALTLIKSYDNYLFNHSVNVSVLALALAQGMGVAEDDLGDIGLAGLLHDIGKTITPKTITLKPGNLTDEEWDVMRRHPLKSSEIVSQMDGVSDLVARLVKEHHVHFDHRGYPDLEPGESTHPYSQMISVADTYDAITTLRPYQKPFTPRDAMQIMERLSGSVIDPKYFEEFVKVIGIYPVGTLVRLDTNEVGVVIETRAENPLQPRLKVVFDPDGKPLARPMDMDLSKPDTYPGEPRAIVSTIDPLLYNVDPTRLV